MASQSTPRDYTTLPIEEITRAESEAHYVPIPVTAHPFVALARDQCFHCGRFGHCRRDCAWFPNQPCGEPPEQWRRMPNGKYYSLKALLRKFPYRSDPPQWQLDLGILGPAIDFRGPMPINSPAYSLRTPSSTQNGQQTSSSRFSQQTRSTPPINSTPMTSMNFTPRTPPRPMSSSSQQSVDRDTFQIPSSMPSSDFIQTPTCAIDTLSPDCSGLEASEPTDYSDVLNWSPL
ncbi:hypothetical protein DFH28DRAFT_877601 [Melampsora americana]|nr:hypothetical protein DFH28DRAFT_877601 [Melampsora americana]